MSKILIIKGADYSQVAVGKVTIDENTTGIIFYDFIHFDGNSYVKTDVTTKANTKVITAAIAEQWSQGHSYAHILGTRTSGISSKDKFVVQLGGNVDEISASIGDMSGYSTGPHAILSEKYSIIADSKSIFINGVQYQTGGTITPGTYPFFLGNTNNGGSPLTNGQYLIGKLYETKFYDSGTLVADFKPCIKDGIAGFYDTVGKKFYGNSGAGTLTAGND